MPNFNEQRTKQKQISFLNIIINYWIKRDKRDSFFTGVYYTMSMSTCDSSSDLKFGKMKLKEKYFVRWFAHFTRTTNSNFKILEW